MNPAIGTAENRKMKWSFILFTCCVLGACCRAQVDSSLATRWHNEGVRSTLFEDLRQNPIHTETDAIRVCDALIELLLDDRVGEKKGLLKKATCEVFGKDRFWKVLVEFKTGQKIEFLLVDWGQVVRIRTSGYTEYACRSLGGYMISAAYHNAAAKTGSERAAWVAADWARLLGWACAALHVRGVTQEGGLWVIDLASEGLDTESFTVKLDDHLRLIEYAVSFLRNE